MRLKHLKKNVKRIMRIEKMKLEDTDWYNELIKDVNWDDKDEALNTLKSCPDVSFKHASKRLRDNEDFIIRVIEEVIPYELCCVKYVSERLKDNKDFALLMIRYYSGSFRYLSERMRDDDDVVTLALKRSGTNIKYASERIRDNEDFALLALRRDPFAMDYLSKRLQRDQVRLINQGGINIILY